MSDLIDRQAAIGLIKSWSGGYDYIETPTDTAVRNFEQLPSAQPDVPDRNVEDMISRQDVLALAKDVILINGEKHRCIDATQIHELPSAQPEPKKGKWIKLYAGNYKCSVCGDWWGNDDNEMVEDFKYCPNCGARMEVENDE